MAAERFWVVFSANLDRNYGLVKVPSPGQLLSEMLELWFWDLPKGVAERRFHEGHFDEEVRFHSHWPSIADIESTLKGLSAIEKECVGFSSGDNCCLAFEPWSQARGYIVLVLSISLLI
jgi:hypothetical protein